MALRLTRPLQEPTLIVTGDLHAPDGLEPGFELWRVPFAGWDEPHDLRARGRCIPRRYVVVDADGLVRASGYTATPTCLPGGPFRLTSLHRSRRRGVALGKNRLQAPNRARCPLLDGPAIDPRGGW